jgi:hypothetical protein
MTCRRDPVDYAPFCPLGLIKLPFGADIPPDSGLLSQIYLVILRGPLQ